MRYGALKPDEAARTNELRALMEQLGMSQRETAEALEVDVRTLRYWAAANPAPPLMAIYALRYLANIKRAELDAEEAAKLLPKEMRDRLDTLDQYDRAGRLADVVSDLSKTK